LIVGDDTCFTASNVFQNNTAAEIGSICGERDPAPVEGDRDLFALTDRAVGISLLAVGTHADSFYFARRRVYHEDVLLLICIARNHIGRRGRKRNKITVA